MSRAAADRNLLFGILAMQMDFVSRDALIAAMNAWVLEKHKPLGQTLVEQGALAADYHALLEQMVAAHLRAHGDDAERSLAAVGSASSIRRDLDPVADPDVQAGLAHLGATRDAAAGEADRTTTYLGPAVTSLGRATATGGRFRVLRFHDRGNLGEVYVARDEELHREVALKQIRAEHADDDQRRARFLVEAEITGGLEHPGIVPVYGLGHHADGRPFYAMRFIKGDSLKEAIRNFHRSEGQNRDPGARALELRKLLGRFLDVCNAVAYAHSRGVLHRDLKPGNIMLGPFGETLVVDWGLAKSLGHPDAAGAGGPGPLVPESGSGVQATEAGARVGTPAFMSPEQASGRLDELGSASDVYSLGATLFCVLTGRAPFEERDLAELRRRVERGEVTPPRQVDPRVPRALEAVCLKAMATKPADRYATPRALAEDIERWLADEPVSAWREPWSARARRWAARHRTGVTAAAAAVVVAAAATGYVLYDAGLRAARQQAQRLATARGRVDALGSAEVRAIPAIVAQLADDRGSVRDRLERMARGEGSGRDDRRRLPAALALLPDDPVQAEFLTARLLNPEATPDEVLVIRDALRQRGRAERVAPRLRRALPARPPDALEATPLRAAGALAGIDPADPALPALAGPLARALVRENPLLIGAWREVFQPIAALLEGPLRSAYTDRSDASARALAFTLLYEFATQPDNPDQAGDLTALIGDADAKEFARVVGRLDTAAHRGRAVALLRPQVREPARFDDDSARRQGRMALALLRLGRAEAVWPLFRHRDDPSVRTELIHGWRRFGLDPAPLAERLLVEPEVSARRALILGLGEFAPDAISESGRRPLVATLLEWYAAAPDPGVHGGLDWLLRRWGRTADLERIDRELARQAPPKGRDWYVAGQVPFAEPAGGAAPRPRDWYVNGQGQTFAIIRPDEFRMGSTKQSDPDCRQEEVQHLRRIGRVYALATREVTVAEYARFLAANPEIVARFDASKTAAAKVLDFRAHPQFQQEIPSVDCAIGVVTWYEAARYCNWLSTVEGLPADQWCYPQEIGPGMKLPVDYLERTGYRLPTEAEWEYACRAGAASARPYGRSEQWLGDYAWYESNSGRRMHPAGLLKPNELGLFDILGNAYEWCTDAYHGAYPPATGGGAAIDALMDASASNEDFRVLRGGTFGVAPALLRSAVRNRYQPTVRGTGNGLRPARTYD